MNPGHEAAEQRAERADADAEGGDDADHLADVHGRGGGAFAAGRGRRRASAVAASWPSASLSFAAANRATCSSMKRMNFL